MSAQAESKSSSFDGLKWLIVIGIIAASIWANQEYADFPSAYRILAMLGAALVAVLFAFSTAKGRAFKQYAHESRIEARKVVWPSRRETVQTTFIVIAFTIVVALILWGIDSIWGTLIEMVMEI